MGSALVYVVVVGLVAAAVYLIAALVFGRGEELAPMPPGATPTRLPARDLTGGDVRDLRFQQALRGYKCSEVDWALERLAAEVDALRDRVAIMEGGAPAPRDAVSGPTPTGPQATVPHPTGSHATGPQRTGPHPTGPTLSGAQPTGAHPTGPALNGPVPQGESTGVGRGTPALDDPRDRR
jgi:DivIVA domain-containing protein